MIKHLKKANINYNKLWQSEFDNIVSKKDKVQDRNNNQIKLEVHDSFEKDEKITTNFEPCYDGDIINKIYHDEKLFKKDGQLSLLEKNYNEFKILSNKKSVEEVLIERAVKTTIQILQDKRLSDSFPNADKVLKDFLFVARRRLNPG